VFEHALRIRVKAETSDITPINGSSTPTTATPDSASIEDRPFQTVGSSGDETLHSASGTESKTQRSGSASIKSTTSNKGKQKSKLAEVETAPKEHADASNLIGKINNLVTTDLGNIVDSRDFLVIPLSIPLQIGLCVWFLYAVLGWRWASLIPFFF
jgi:hypothetical protein